jgi:cation transport protein ChaC
MSRSLALTREMIRARFPRPAPDDRSAMPLLPDEEIREITEATLAFRPTGEDIWVFAYGSLIWKPEMEFVDQRQALLPGYHRTFCLWQRRYRGSQLRPGLMLGLDRGGSCRGVTFRIEGRRRSEVLAPVFRRELIANGYRPRWVRLDTPTGALDAVAFMANRAAERYAGKLSDDVVAAHIASACGHIGPAAEYLLETVAHLESLGIHDRYLWRMQKRVAHRLATSQTEMGRMEGALVEAESKDVPAAPQ